MPRATRDPATLALDTLARTIWGEARGESYEGKVAVGHVVLNRVEANAWYGDDIGQVCTKPWQFSCWNYNDPNRKRLDDCHQTPQWLVCLRAAAEAMTAEKDPTDGATHYHADYVTPQWMSAPNMHHTVTIGRHRFYREQL